MQDNNPYEIKQTNINDEYKKGCSKNIQSNLLSKLENLLEKWDLDNKKEASINEKEIDLMDTKAQKILLTMKSRAKKVTNISNECKSSNIRNIDSCIEKSSSTEKEKASTVKIENYDHIIRYANCFKENQNIRYCNNAIHTKMNCLMLEKR